MNMSMGFFVKYTPKNLWMNKFYFLSTKQALKSYKVKEIK